MLNPSLELSIIMPCLNEAKSLAICIQKAKTFLTTNQISGEIIVADNGSADGSREIAQQNGAKVIDVTIKGYGAALMGGIEAAQGRYVIFGDSDDSYDFLNLMPFVKALCNGNELVMGNRFKGGIAPGAMPFLHKYLGNPVLSFIGRLFFGSKCGDFHCGLRGFNREAILQLGLKTTGMEFASEMIVKATIHNLRIAEVPTTLAKDKRDRPSHLHTWRDGWRHLRFLLLYSPRWLFFYPGLVLVFGGCGMMAALLPGPLTISNVSFDVHTLVVSSAAIISGVQITMFGLLARQFASSHGLLPATPRFDAVQGWFSLERLLVIGFVVMIAGITELAIATAGWEHTHFGELDYKTTMRDVVPSTTLIITGLQIIFFAFFSGLLKLGLIDTAKNKG